MLDVADRPIVIIGGGRVAARKAAGLIDAGAKQITVVSPAFCEQMPANVQRIVERYRTEHLTGAQLVFAATDVREVNDAVVHDARSRGVLVQRVDGDETEPGDFTTPAVHREGPIVLAVSAGGSPPLAAMIRDRLREQLDPVWSDMAAAMKTLRPVILQSVDAEKRRRLFHRAASPEGVEAFRKNGVDGLRKWILNDG